MTTLGELVRDGGGGIQTGPFGSQLHASDYVPSGIPVIMPANMLDGKINLDGIAYISKEDANRLSKHLVQSGDIVYSRRGDVTRNVLITKDEVGYFCGTGCLLIRPGQEVNPKFLAYHLNNPGNKTWIKSRAIGATMPNLNTGILSEIPLSIPKRKDQDYIAHSLGTIDKKIELLRQQNATLESMAQALFKSWFVDFDPVIDNALGAGRVVPAAWGVRGALRGAVLAGGAYSGLPEEVKSLFPDSFVFSDELGKWVPEGWTTDKFSESVTVKYGKDHKKLLEGPYPVYGSGGLMRRVDSVLYDKESVLIPRKGTLSNVMYVNEPFWSVDTMFYTILKKECLAKYVFYFISKFNLTEMNVGSAVPSMTTAVLNNLDMLLPDSSLLELFDNKVEKFYLKKQQNVKQIQTLTRLRDVLLPELISGRLGV
jgi:type I restriction enzyme S subunit